MSTLASKPVADAVDVKCTDNEWSDWGERHGRQSREGSGRAMREAAEIQLIVDGRRVSAPLAWFPRLLRATPKQRANWRLIGRGIGIHWDDVDEDISIRSLLAS